MKIDKTVFDTHAALDLNGDFQTEDAASLLQEIEELRAGGVTRIAANLRRVKYLNSTALGTMVKARELLRSESGDFVIVKPSPISREIMSQTGLDSVIPMFDDEESAGRYLAEGGSGATASDTNRETAEDRVGPRSVMFSFPDERGDLFKGRSHRGVATIESVDPEGIVFVWDASRHDLGPDQVARMFASGSAVQTKFQIKLIRKDYFQISAKIYKFANASDGTVMVRATWSQLPDDDRDDLARFRDDMAYLKSQVSGGAEG